MKTVYVSSALALLFGLGAAAGVAPSAQAAGEIVVAQAGGQGGVGGSDATGAVHPMEVHPARPEFTMQCDVEGTGFVTTDEARACYDAYFGSISGGGDQLSLEQFQAGLPDVEDPETAFTAADVDRDQRVSREEWLQWRERGFAETAPEGQLPVEDYERWHYGGSTVGG